MNKDQRTILWLLGAVLFTMLVFPPFYFQYSTGVIDNLGYRLIFNPPTVGDGFNSPAGLIHVPTLLLQILVAILLAGIAFLLTSRSSKTDHGKAHESLDINTKTKINYFRIFKRLTVTFLALAVAAVFVSLLRTVYPASIEAAFIRAVIPVITIFGVWRWTARFR